MLNSECLTEYRKSINCRTVFFKILRESVHKIELNDF